MIKTCTKCGYTGDQFRKKRSVCIVCDREMSRIRMERYHKTPAYKQWLIESRELRRSLKEKYRRQKSVKKRDQKIYDSHVKAYIKHYANVAIKAAKELLHDAHVKCMKSMSDAEWFRWKYKTDAEFNANQRIRNQLKKLSQKYPMIGDQMRAAIKRNGSSPMAEKILGYSMSNLRSHIERQFTKGMTWDAFMSGEIHIDHIIPKSTLNLNDDDEIRKCWCLSNLRPMWAKENLAKRAKIVCLI